MNISSFPHIVNLACKAVISHFSDLEYAQEPQNGEEHMLSLDAVPGDAIATLRALIRAVRVKSHKIHPHAITYKLFLDTIIVTPSTILFNSHVASLEKRAPAFT